MQINDPKNSQSWLDRFGEFHPVSGSHSSWALNSGKTLEDLFSTGWMRITYLGDELIANNGEKVKLNPKQLRSLIDFAIFSKKFNSITYDNDDQSYVIWGNAQEQVNFKEWLFNV